jgi:hypothetical protein
MRRVQRILLLSLLLGAGFGADAQVIAARIDTLSARDGYVIRELFCNPGFKEYSKVLVVDPP